MKKILALFTLAILIVAGCRPPTPTKPPATQPNEFSSYNCQIMAIGNGTLEVHFLRGHNGIIHSVNVDEKTVVVLLNGKHGKLSDLTVGQLAKLFWVADPNSPRQQRIVRIEGLLVGVDWWLEKVAVLEVGLMVNTNDKVSEEDTLWFIPPDFYFHPHEAFTVVLKKDEMTTLLGHVQLDGLLPLEDTPAPPYLELAIGMGCTDRWSARLTPETLQWLEGVRTDLPEQAAKKLDLLLAKVRKQIGVSTSQPATQPALDLSDPKVTLETALKAIRAGDAATYKACIYMPKESDGPQVDAIVAHEIAGQQLRQAAAAKFGQDAERLFHRSGLWGFEDLTKILGNIKSGTVAVKGDTAVFHPPSSCREWQFRRIDGAWRIDWTNYIGSISEENRRVEMVRDAHVMSEIAKQISAGAFKDVEEAKAGWALKTIASDTASPPTAPATATLPVNRWTKKALQANLSPLQKAAYEQLGQVHRCELSQGDNPGPPYELDQPVPGSPKAVTNLHDMGLDVVPILTEALDDITMTKTVSEGHSGQHYTHQVNDIVVRLITRICERTFVLGVEPEPQQKVIDEVIGKPELAPQFQKVILEWYKVNRPKTQLERKLADVDDSFFRNRFDAVEWLGRAKEAKGVPVIVKHLEGRMAEAEPMGDTLKESELSECAFALGQIGDKGGLAVVKRVCDLFSTEMAKDRWGKGHKIGGSGEIHDLFEAYHGLALLGEKEAAVKALTRYFEINHGGLDVPSQREFTERLEKAANWGVEMGGAATQPANEKSSGSIKGSVIGDKAGRKVANATVELRTADRRVIACAKTDANGDFGLDNIPAGDGYIISVLAPVGRAGAGGGKNGVSVEAGKETDVGGIAVSALPG